MNNKIRNINFKVPNQGIYYTACRYKDIFSMIFFVISLCFVLSTDALCQVSGTKDTINVL
jgi:hypothetical protein